MITSKDNFEQMKNKPLRQCRLVGLKYHFEFSLHLAFLLGTKTPLSNMLPLLHKTIPTALYFEDLLSNLNLSLINSSQSVSKVRY